MRDIDEKEGRIKARVIGQIMDIYVNNNPIRDANWYGEKFDQLYDKSLEELKSLLTVTILIK